MMWDPLLAPGIALLHGGRHGLRGFHQELAHHALHTRDGTVLWCDGDHGFDPYHFAELNLTRGRDADDGAERLLVKRCMTPFQWDTVLTKHLGEKLLGLHASLVLAAPFDRLFSTDELKDWEQEDYVAYALKHLAGLAKEHAVPLLLSVDPAWWRTHPTLAQMTWDACKVRWRIDAIGGPWPRYRAEGNGAVIDPGLRTRTTLLDFLEPSLTFVR